MPIYVYSCPVCDVVLEEIRPVGFSDWPPAECPVCAGLCEREITSALVMRSNGITESTEKVTIDDEMAPSNKRNAHAAGCPCCRGV